MGINTSGLHSAYQLEYQPVPVFNRENLPYIIEAIHARRTHPEELSYGAHLIRNGGAEVVAEGIELIREYLPEEEKTVKPRKIEFGPQIERGMKKVMVGLGHTDRGIKNDITVHLAFKGMADFIILNDPHFPQQRLIEIGVDLTEGWFTSSKYPYELNGIPMRTIVGEDDILIFDHTLPHAFRSLTEDRLSRGTFFSIPAPKQALRPANYML